MYSACSWPPEIFLAIACMTVSYGRIGYAVTTSRSARVRASATASLPEMRSSLSSLAAGAALVATAMTVDPPLTRLGRGVFAGNARGDLDAARVQVLLQLLFVLTAEAEAVRADRRDLVLDLGAEPRLVGALVLAPHVPLARVVGEGGFVHHRDAVLHGAHSLAHAAAAARFHRRVEGAVRHDVEHGVGTRDPDRKSTRLNSSHIPLPRIP